MRRGTLLLIALLSLSSPFVGAVEKKDPPKLELADDEKAILDLTNKARASEKLPPLTANAALTRAARDHSTNMAKQGKLAHELDGKRAKDRVKVAGYDYDELAENVGVAESASPEQIVESWLKSKTHRENLLSPTMTEIGIGTGKSANGETYYTQVFAKPHKK